MPTGGQGELTGPVPLPFGLVSCCFIHQGIILLQRALLLPSESRRMGEDACNDITFHPKLHWVLNTAVIEYGTDT